MFTYETHVLPFKNQYKKIIVPEPKIKRIKEFVSELIKIKEKESHHSIDNRSHFKRYYTGTLGEAALEEYLEVDNIIDWTIGNSNHYHKPDLSNIGVKAGIKTVEYGLFPVIFKNSYSSEVIMIKVSDNHIVLCGLATKNILNSYQSDELIKDSYLRQRGTKTGFYGFEYLKTFSKLDELRKMSPIKNK
ncbi:hypothetical protein GH839_21525 [Bacillus thuringiensis]|uniref:hypothetical protein n=1 Tax=Bacillus pacificus TaxID=2026187 RepID=UPI00129885A9|nr:hypothetical protein [Bacillus pacificus]MCU5068336.1 hypothetical protein [Bacillus pacificus]MRB23433.1 hypothetical protein [Bacillus thuringiensis]